METIYDINFDDTKVRLFIGREELELEDESTPSFDQVENYLIFNYSFETKENIIKSLAEMIPNLKWIEFKDRVNGGWKGVRINL